ncbi:TRAP transporter substrate-binding protein [Ramlibacter sp. 2FC]|uniref:TRAP transporter substrate-binding protein n=1 Tax=Ramlibacter sp. 2FC TaxID=2502188 RepID=UPI0010F99D87|nr:TRAP transporter substrate-binding protein [Ramlibacter sp. 2FC]
MKTWKTLIIAAAATLPLAALAQQAGADFKERTIRVSHVVPKDHPFQVGIDKFAEIVAQKTGGKMKMRGYPDGQLGAELQSISSAQGGVLEMTLVSTAATASVVKEFGVYDLPFLFSDFKEADLVLDGPIGRKLLDKLPEKNLVGLCYFENGFRHVTNSRRPISKAEDLKGLKIRTIQNPVFIDIFNTLGANALPMPFTEVFTALESKAIDGQETPYSNIWGNRFYEVQKYVSNTGHIYGAAVVLVGKKFWDQLSGAEQKLLQESCNTARDHERSFNRAEDPKLLAQIKAKGAVYTEIAPAERARMRELLKPVYEKYARNLGEDLVKQTLAELDKHRVAAK